ncbi:MAG TPA: hypothetical protein PJ988_05910 [Anaerolinea sp.]|nr:hypothetical protein [Anaerolinea sp.]
MGYVNDKAFAQFIPTNLIIKTAGTWTPTLSANTIAEIRGAAGATFNLMIPVLIPSNAEALKGAKLVSIEVNYKIAVANMTSMGTVELEKMTISAAGVVTGVAAAVAVDGGHNSSVLRSAIGDHRLKVTLTTPVYIDNDEAYWLYMTASAPASTIFSLWGAIANYELRA